MTVTFEAIKELLAHPYIRKRQEGLGMLEQRLNDNQDVRRCIELLQEVIEQSEYMIVSEQAQKILDNWQRKNQVVRLPNDRQHMFGATCPHCRKLRYFDKRKVCGSHDTIVLGKGEDKTDNLLLDCPECGKQIAVAVPCEGY